MLLMYGYLTRGRTNSETVIGDTIIQKLNEDKEN